ncbi:hypothetical protein DLH72_04900, partial [Candidatus Gracilibacteria bacterium]
MDAIYKKAKDYFVYTLLSWDDAVSKVENRAENTKYLGDGEYKKEIIKYINKARSNHKITYFENKKTSTAYNVCEKPDGEIIIVFRGSDSKIDWISDFLFFKQKFENENKELFITMSNEDFENL